jgi:hypothetical protein
MKKLLLCLLAAALMLTLLPAAPASAASLTDQTEALRAVRALGILVGDEKGNMNLEGDVTRAQFAKMLTVAATGGEGATGYSPFRDVRYSHWASGYIKTASDSGWFLGYADGTFRPDNTILLEEAATAALRMLGYTATDYAGMYPSAQLSKYRELGLDEHVSASHGPRMTRLDCAFLFYNLMGAATPTGQPLAVQRGYTLDASGHIDVPALLIRDAKGPYVADASAWPDSLPFALAGADIYLNGKTADALTPAPYDVYYYHADSHTVWAYTDKAIGLYTAAQPSLSAPTSVPVAGVNYTLATGVAAQKLSTSGDFAYGDPVALLLGRDGAVVDVLPADAVDGRKYGVVTQAATTVYPSGGGTKTGYMITLAATDGGSYSYLCQNTFIAAGDLVSAGYVDGVAEVSRLQGRSLTGAVTATAIGKTPLAAGVRILEVSKDNSAFAILYPARLTGARLEGRDVLYYALDSAGAVCDLILRDCTGDLYTYGVLITADESETEIPATPPETMPTTVYSGNYAWIANGQPGALRLSDRLLGADNDVGPVRITMNNGAPSDFTRLTPHALSAVSAVSALSGADTLAVSANVQVYLRDGDAYTLLPLSSVTGDGYTLQGYTDSGFSAGGLVRVIIATVA